MTACVRDHAVSGSHAPPCACTTDCPDHDGHCGGCLPAPADRGLLCPGCYRRLTDHLGAREDPSDDKAPHGLPWAWEHLGQFTVPAARPADGAGGRELQVPISLAVLDLRAEIRDRLGSIAADLAERLGMAGPPGVRLTTDPTCRHIGRDWHIVRRSAAWLLAQAEQLAAGAGVRPSESDVPSLLGVEDDGDDPAEEHVLLAAEAVRAVCDDLADLMSRAHALAPWRPAPTHIDGIPCGCGQVALHDHGDEIRCHGCRRSYTREQYRILTVVLARRSEREAQHA